MRLFTAISLPESILYRLESFLAPLRPLADIRWSPLANLHITTKFIGEWPTERLHELTTGLAQVSSPPLKVTLRGLGWFPNSRSPHVFWMGVEGGEDLHRLADATERTVGGLGCPREQRAFQPHLTLARMRRETNLRALRSAVEALPSPLFPACEVSEFHLYQSDSGTHRKLQTFGLVRSSE